MNRKRGLTLVEMLIVIAIIGTLVALLLPAIQSARASAFKTSCSNRMRQVGLAMTMFCDANQGRFPQNAHAGAGNSWIYTLAPYLEDMDVVRICPLDPNADLRLTNKQTSYVISGYITSASQAASVLEMRKLKAPSRTITVCEGSNLRSVSNLGAEHTHPWNWFSAANITAGTVWAEALKEIQPNQHMGDSANYLYADAHVETISALDLRTRAEAGDNFALPENGGMTP